jgi:4-hydroxybenzoate polyprenyltransferase
MIRKIANKFCLILKLMRAHNPTAYLLVFFPVSFALALTHNTAKAIELLPLFLLGSIITRSAGCIINDIHDRNIDSHVERTKNRPLANKTLTLTEALIVLGFLSSLALIMLFQLSKTAIYIGIIAAALVFVYPLMKRFTNYAQVVLGLTYNLGALIAYTSVETTLSLSAIIMYLGCCLWTIGYDTIYAFMDLRDDKKIKINSMAILLEKYNYKMWLSILYCTFILLFIIANIIANNKISSPIIICASTLLLWQAYTIDITIPKNCWKRFKLNNIVGGLLIISQVITV